MNPREQPMTETSDRRRHRRHSSKSKVRLSAEPTTITGEVENISRSGLLFFADGSFRVTVEIEEDGQATKRSGRLVRGQRIRGNTFGWAIEFDA
jgi:PilZ domain